MANGNNKQNEAGQNGGTFGEKLGEGLGETLGDAFTDENGQNGGAAPATQGGGPDARQVALDMAAGLRDRQGDPTASGKQEGLSPVSASKARRARQLLDQIQGGGQGGGAMRAPQPPGGGQQAPTPKGPDNPGAPPQVEGGRGYTRRPQIQDVLAPAFSTQLPDQLQDWSLDLWQWIVDEIGLEGGDDWMSFMAQLAGRWLPSRHDSQMDRCKWEIMANSLDDEKRKVAMQWQCGMDEPLGSGDQEELHQLWLMLEVATSDYDVKHDMLSDWIGSSNPYK